MQVREAAITDAGAIAQVLVHTFLVAHRGQIPEEVWRWREREWTPEFVSQVWERMLRDLRNGMRPRECAFVAEAASGEIVGIAKGEPANTEGDSVTGEVNAEVSALYVHPNYQGRGIGRRLLAAVAAHQAAQGATALQVGTLVTNMPARCFYEAMGARCVTEREIEDGGYPLREVIYHWPDINSINPA